MKTSWLVLVSLLLSSSAIAGCVTEAPVSETTVMLQEAPVHDGSDWLMTMTAGEVIHAPGGYLAMAPLKTTCDDESGCQAEQVVTVRVADGVAPDVTVASLCADEQARGAEVVLRTCMAGEASIAERAKLSSPDGDNAVGGACYFCTSSTCLNNSKYKQRKEGTIHGCFPEFWKECCWAINGGCCY
jgi:hypothetical protein